MPMHASASHMGHGVCGVPTLGPSRRMVLSVRPLILVDVITIALALQFLFLKVNTSVNTHLKLTVHDFTRVKPAIQMKGPLHQFPSAVPIVVGPHGSGQGKTPAPSVVLYNQTASSPVQFLNQAACGVRNSPV